MLLLLLPAGDMLLVSSIDSCHYLYRVSGLDREPLACLTGHRTSSFCVKSCFSPSGSHVLSGSTDKRAYIWDVSTQLAWHRSWAAMADAITAQGAGSETQQRLSSVSDMLPIVHLPLVFLKLADAYQAPLPIIPTDMLCYCVCVVMCTGVSSQ